MGQHVHTTAGAVAQSTAGGPPREFMHVDFLEEIGSMMIMAAIGADTKS